MDQAVSSNETFPQLVAEATHFVELPPAQSIATDDDHIGCISGRLGSTLQGLLAKGQWGSRWKEVPNIIKLKAAFQALKAFQDQVKGANVTLHMGNKVWSPMCIAREERRVEHS